MQVIGAGFGRTGTLSLRLAFEQLGFGPCFHGSVVAGQPEMIRSWLAADEDPAKADWSALLGEYNSTVDWPAAAYWRELAEYFPDAKVVLSVRDPQTWYDSVQKTLFWLPLSVPTPVRRFFGRVAVKSAPWFPPLPALSQKVIFDRVFDDNLDRDHAVEVFQQHIEQVKATIPADRLLVYKVAEGWEPLCAFLGVPVPATDFPRVNDSESFRSTWKIAFRGYAARLPASAGAAIADVTWARKKAPEPVKREQVSAPGN
jgi:hypothetical protein